MTTDDAFLGQRDRVASTPLQTTMVLNYRKNMKLTNFLQFRHISRAYKMSYKNSALKTILLGIFLFSQLLAASFASGSLQVLAKTHEAGSPNMRVDRFPLSDNNTLVVGENVTIVMIINNTSDKPLFDVKFTQYYPNISDSNLLKLVSSTNLSFTEFNVSYDYLVILPLSWKVFNVTLQATSGKQPFSTVTIDPVNVSFLYDSLYIPSWRMSDIDALQNPQTLAFNVTDTSIFSVGTRIPGSIDISSFAPIGLIVVPLGVMFVASFVWSLRNKRNYRKG